MLLLRYRTRKLVFRGLVVLYIFAASWLLLFANGYRIQLKPFVLSKTGNILATFTPTRAGVFLDGKFVTNSSPARIRSIFPGTHQITISADGYLPYERAIRIDPQQTEFVSDIFLIKNVTATPYTLDHPTTEPSSPEAILSQLTGNTVALQSDPHLGTRIMINGKPATRDVGVGIWKIVGGDTNMLALARLDTDQIQFRSWDELDVPVATLPGHTLVSHVFNGAHSLIAVSTFEIWNFNTDSQTAELVYRFSSPILNVITVPSTTLVITALPDQIVAFHLGDHHYIPTVIARGSIINQTVNEAGDSLIYSTHDGVATSTFVRALY